MKNILYFLLLAAMPALATVDFNGTSQFGTLADDARIQFGTGEGTVLCRFNADTVIYGPSSQGTILGKNYLGFELAIYEGKLGGYFGSSTGIGGAATLSTGVWYSAAIRRSGTTIQLYLNGVADGASATSSGSASEIGVPFYVGKRHGGTPFYFDGRVAEVALYNTALTVAEIAAYAAGVSPLKIRPQNLKAYTRLVKATDAIDLMAPASISFTGSPTTADHPRVYR